MKGYVMGVLMCLRGPQGPIYFEEFQGSRSLEHGLSSIALRSRHPEDWQEIRIVLWLMTDDVEYIAERRDGGHRLGTPEPHPDEPASRLSTID